VVVEEKGKEQGQCEYFAHKRNEDVHVLWRSSQAFESPGPHRPFASNPMANLTDIAVIDFERFRLGEPVEQKAIAKEIVKSFQDIGFVYLKSHGLSQDTVDSMFAWVNLFQSRVPPTGP